MKDPNAEAERCERCLAYHAGRGAICGACVKAKMNKQRWYVVGEYVFTLHPKHPWNAGVYIRTDRCVLFVDCPQCKAKAGELCIGVTGPHGTTHHMRRTAYQRAKREIDPDRKPTTKRIVIYENDQVREETR